MGLRSWLDDLSGLIFPNLCEVCSTTLVRGENTLCLQCLCDMPRTNLHRQSFNEIHKRLAGHTPIERAAAYFYYYKESPYARMIQNAKYNSRPRLARTLAAMFAREISADGFFDGIELLLPVPLHYLKEFRRGYNQSREIALGISSVTGIPVGSNLTATRGHSTQTRRGPFERWLNTEGIYAAEDPQELDGKHILLIDDVITTGATILRCADTIHSAAPTATVSVVSLGFTHGT